MKTIILVALALGLSACGGGSGGSSPSTPSTTELEGKWIYSSDVHPTGTACGLDSSGNYGQRSTVTFTGNQYTYTNENCLIISGNTGGYINSDAANGTFVIGGIYVSSSDPTSQMRALDLTSAGTTKYTSYNLTGNALHIATQFQTFDGSTSDKRAFQIASFLDAVTHKLISNPTFLKQ